MPKIAQYLAGYDLHKGDQFGDYTLEEIHVGHVQIKRYQLYHYPTKLVFKYTGGKKGNSNQLIKKLEEHLQNRTIHTSYGNPYDCDFGKLRVTGEDSESVVVESIGSCTRVHSSSSGK